MNVNGNKIYIVNDDSYTTTTNQHLSEMRRAIPCDANVFSVCHDGFVCGFSGMGSFPNYDVLDENEQLYLIKKWILATHNNLVKFKTSKSYSDEERFELKWWNQVVKMIELGKATTIAKLAKTSAREIYAKWAIRLGMDEAKEVRRMLSALKNGATDVKQLIIATFGEEVYDNYVKRTKGPRTAAHTRKINKFISRVGYSPYSIKWSNDLDYKEWVDRVKNLTPKNFTYIAPKHPYYTPVAGLLQVTSDKIKKWSKDGELVQKLYELYRKNLQILLSNKESRLKQNRIRDAKTRLERHIGIFGYNFNVHVLHHVYNGKGIDIDFRYHHFTDLTMQEYTDFTKMSPDQQKEFIYNKREEIYAYLSEQTSELNARREQAEQARLERELRKAKQEEKREYIASEMAKGAEAIRRLYHEGLIDNPGNGIEVCRGGNALLRVEGGLVATSKGVIVSFNECKRLWKAISLWHNYDKEFTPDETVHGAGHYGNWAISRYQNDIMIAGCHAIHYDEMKYIAEQLNLI